MKKFIISTLISLIGLSLFAQSLPAFTEADNAFVADAKSFKEDYGDYCKVINLTDKNDFAFDIYVMKSNKKEWTFAGTATLNGLLDTDTIDSELNGSFGRYRYFAIVPKDGNTYNITASPDELNMYVVRHYYFAFIVDSTEDTPANIRNNSTIIDVDSISGKFKDNIKFSSSSSEADLDFVVYGFDSADATKWEVVGKTHLKEAGDTDNMETVLTGIDVKKCKFYAIYNQNGKKYEVSASKSHNDLYIDIK